MCDLRKVVNWKPSPLFVEVQNINREIMKCIEQKEYDKAFLCIKFILNTDFNEKELFQKTWKANIIHSSAYLGDHAAAISFLDNIDTVEERDSILWSLAILYSVNDDRENFNNVLLLINNAEHKHQLEQNWESYGTITE